MSIESCVDVDSEDAITSEPVDKRIITVQPYNPMKQPQKKNLKKEGPYIGSDKKI